ncbi:murein transglycosylase A [Geothermobacter hydrogeniphilus]|nr:MltA domain-containing protein [Geothermobacter hydrogeniphilus]
MKKISWFSLLLSLLLPAACVKAPPEKPPVAAPAAVPVDWSDVEGWLRDDPRPALEVFRRGCGALRWRSGWEQVCARLSELENPTEVDARQFFRTWFQPWRLQQEDGSATGLLTGYYVPDLRGSRTPDERYRYPLYAVPDDLLVIDLGDLYPELGSYRLRGRLDGRRVVPYWDRAAIDAHPERLVGKELFWVDDPVELFFLQIQGSGRILLPDGERVMVNYADQNGHPYRSIGKLLLEKGAMTREQMSMQNIRAWACRHPDQVAALLEENPSYVFFRELGPEFQSPPGALGIPLMPERSLAVDPRFVPLGAPLFVATTWPVGDAPLWRLMVAQDTGGAIKGRVRADFFWGMGAEAGALAGRMKQDVRLWLLLPRGVTPPSVKGEM